LLTLAQPEKENRRPSSTAAPTPVTTSRLGRLMTPKTMTSPTSRWRALRAPRRIWSTRRPARSWALMTNRRYFQFDTRSRLRRFTARGYPRVEVRFCSPTRLVTKTAGASGWFVRSGAS